MPPPVVRDWDRIRQLAKAMDSDGCTLVTQAYQDCCYLHDLCYRTGRDPDTGEPVTYEQADALLRDCIRAKSRLGRFSPMASIRYLGVRLFGRFFR